MTKFSFNNIPAFSDSDKIVVIGIVGENQSEFDNATEQNKISITCEWQKSENVLYLHLPNFFNGKNIMKYLSSPQDDTRKPSSDGVNLARQKCEYLVIFGDMLTDYCHSILLMFHICHIIVLHSPGAKFDVNLLNIFKAIDTIRLELQPKLTELLSSVVNAEWATHARFCCPRVLFYFESCPRQLRNVDLSKIKKFEHSIEDQIYHILRKARIITNVCAKSLFAIPKNEEFVYVNNGSLESKPDIANALRNLVLMCQGVKTIPEWNAEESEAEKQGSFTQFLQVHVDIAYGTGFDDNVGKYAANSHFFQLPSAAVWREAASHLHHFFESEECEGVWENLWNLVSVDTKFSQARCAKVLPIAQASYSEGLPAHYSSEHHLQRLSVATGVFDAMARGPLCAQKRKTLEENCEKIWKSRRLCEQLSLTGNPCVKPEHSLEGEESHSSGVRYPAACNCGRTKLQRDDPYTLKQANYTFYIEADCNHCPTLTAIHCPIFVPTGDDCTEVQVIEEIHQTWAVDEIICETLSGESENTLSSENLYLDPLTEREKGIARQVSTTEYLPGILHLESPSGLLPAFPSWSLVCIGASSLYSHSVGLPEHLQPGLLPHTNCLLPWDCAVKSDQIASQWRRRGPLTVKIFIGLEYECVRGHRFMLCGPEESGASMAMSDTPLYTHCVCRGNKTLLAQLMRVHVVTPKAPVNVTLDPKVQPVAGGPIFIPGWEKPAKLSASAYWVLRLPFIYGSERGILPRPNVPVTSSVKGRLLANCIGLSD